MKKFIILIITAITLNVMQSLASTPLKHLFPVKTPDKTFKISSKSKTIKMTKGQTYHMKTKLRKNRYYYIALKGKRFLGHVQCQIIVPSENNKVIFDNAAYEFDKNILFYNDTDKDVVIYFKTMPCCFENKPAKKGNVKLLLANKKIKTNETLNLDTDYNIYALN